MPPESVARQTDPTSADIAHRPYHALRHRDYRSLWAAQLVSLTGSQMQTVALNWHVYLLTGSPLALGFVGLTRVLPIVGLSLWAGVVADRHDRRWVMFTAQSVMTAVAVALAAVTFAGRETLWLLYALSAAQAAALAFDNPARQALVPRLVPRSDLPGALSLNLTAFHAAMIGGPALAGFLIAGGGFAPLRPSVAPAAARPTMALASIYLLNALSFASVLLALATMRTSGRAETDGSSSAGARAALRQGLRFVLTTPMIVWTMALDFFATFFSGALSLLPIFADRVLGVGPRGYGWLVAGPALGALLGSLYTSVLPLPRRQGQLLLWSVAAYGASTIVYGFSRSFALTFLALAGSGLADLVSTVIRQMIRQLVTPDALRGRMTSVNMIFFMGGPQLGELEAGVVAALFASVTTGVTVAVVSGGIATLLVTAVVAAAAPAVRKYRA
jgi:MFS family permease